MKTTRTYLAVFLAIAMVLMLGGCSKKSNVVITPYLRP